MADGTFPSVISKDVDVNATGNPIYVQLSDGTSAVGVTSGAVDVYITGGSSAGTEYTEDVATVTATGVANLVERIDTPATITPVVGDWTKLYANANGSQWVAVDGEVSINDGGNAITIDGTVAVSSVGGTVAVTQSGAWTVSATQSGVWDIGTVTTLTGITNDVSIDDGGNSITIDDGGNAITVDGAVEVSKNVAGNSAINPIYVYNVQAENTNIQIHDYDTASAVASAGTSNHDYTVGGKFYLTSVIVAGSGNIKFEIQVGPLASLSTVATGFLNGREGDSKQYFFDPVVQVPNTSTGTVRVIRTNRQGSATDVYSTIIGNDISAS